MILYHKMKFFARGFLNISVGFYKIIDSLLGGVVPMRSRFAFGVAKGEKVPKKAKAGEIKFLCFSSWFMLDSSYFPVSSRYFAGVVMVLGISRGGRPMVAPSGADSLIGQPRTSVPYKMRYTLGSTCEGSCQPIRLTEG